MSAKVLSRYLTTGILLAIIIGFPIRVLGQEPIYHTVGFGETVASIAWRYGLAIDDIVLANDLVTPHLLYPGQRLIIPIVADYETHTVQPGETLSQIAEAYGLSTWELARANGIWNLHMIYAGQKLLIPRSDSMMPPAQLAPISIVSPVPSQSVQGSLLVRGWGRSPDNLLNICLDDAQGNRLLQIVTPIDAEIGQMGPFEATLDLSQIQQKQRARLSVFAQNPIDGAIEQLSSVTILIDTD